MFFYLLVLAYFIPTKITLMIGFLYLIFCSVFFLIKYKKYQLVRKKTVAISHDEKFQKFLTKEEKEELDLMFTTGKHK